MKLIVALLLSANTFALDYKIVCESNGYAGDSVAQAVEACAQHSTSRRDRCSKDVTCKTYKTHCEAQSYAGDNVFSAVQACAQYSRRSRKQCSSSVTCK
jgi:hypothetical protein